ncbi:hypothetical protein D9M69_542490 [compost metagenome]
MYWHPFVTIIVVRATTRGWADIFANKLPDSIFSMRTCPSDMLIFNRWQLISTMDEIASSFFEKESSAISEGMYMVTAGDSGF